MNLFLKTLPVFYCFLFLMMIPFVYSAAGQQRTEASATPLECKIFVKNGLYAPKEHPVLFGDEYTVPPIRMHFAKPVAPGETPVKITIFYVWEWLRFPSPEHSTGSWEEAEDIVHCTGIVPEKNLIIPSYTVRPNAWYSGKYANENRNRPRFTRIEVLLETANCYNPALHFDKKELNRFRDAVAIITMRCGGLPKYRFEKLDKVWA